LIQPMSVVYPAVRVGPPKRELGAEGRTGTNEGAGMPTVRQSIVDLLCRGEFSAREVSQALGIREKEVFDHLGHIGRSVARRNKRLIVCPARCLQCAFVFVARGSYRKPGRCPVCKGEHIQDPRYTVRT